MKAILQYQEVEKSSNSDTLTCTARYITDLAMSDYTYDDIKAFFTDDKNNVKIKTIFIDGATGGNWGAEIKVCNCRKPLPYLLGNWNDDEQDREKTGSASGSACESESCNSES